MNLMQKAKELAEVYRRNPNIEAILLAGSVAKHMQDEHSDIELHIFWSFPPRDEDRMSPIREVSGRILEYHPYEDEEWSESFLTQEGIKLEISNFLSETVERFTSDVVNRYETDYDKQCIVASLYGGVGLYGEAKVGEWKEKIAVYPSELAERMITKNLWLGNRWKNRNALLKREDWLMYYTVLCDVENKLFGVLFGLNHMYVHHPLFKWMAHSISQMTIKPDKLHERMAGVLTENPENSVKELEALVGEVMELVEEHIPHLNIRGQKEDLGFTK
ncbi:DUF4037 domain-containing protein [Salimicrobium halophilum]|uniref:DUF4037 domain-containing protein n=1 Tax=Salimicrobium halophilum TaxID=86666 RepID=A0A1G8QXL2_9BACI|nr:DUF4037 domain-containing protein [Salimicrobium halophilum]SDJ09411.1 protein of unknown function [Salimicrobium halophilum]